MNIKKIEEFDTLAFTDVQGKLRVIHGCPLTKLEEFAAVRSLLWREVKKETDQGNTDITVQSLFHSNSFFAQMCLRALELCGISPDWVDLNMMAQLLFPFTWEGRTTEGLLVQLNFPSATDEDGDREAIAQPSKKASWDDLLASLWGATDNLQSAMELADTVPWRKLHATVEARGEQMYEARKKAGGMTKQEEELEIAKAYKEYLAKKKIQDDQQVAKEKLNERFSVGADNSFNNPDDWVGQ